MKITLGQLRRIIVREIRAHDDEGLDQFWGVPLSAAEYDEIDAQDRASAGQLKDRAGHPSYERAKAHGGPVQWDDAEQRWYGMRWDSQVGDLARIID